MQVRFWGTRGSIPAALTAHALREKIVAALVAGAGHALDTTDKARAFAETLPFSVSNTFGGNSSCLELRSEGAGRVLLDMGSGARAASLGLFFEPGVRPRFFAEGDSSAAASPSMTLAFWASVNVRMSAARVSWRSI